MRKFVVYSKNAHTSPVISNLKAAGRIDVLLHSIISSMFASNTFRDDVELHLILMGPPNSPRHITIRKRQGNTVSKKNLKKLIELALRRYKDGEVREVHPGVFVDNYSIQEVVEGFVSEGLDGNIFVMDAYGEHIQDLIVDKKIDCNSVFILGDHDGFDGKVKKFLKKNVTRLSLGPQMYFTSQAITIINYELDNI